MGKNCKGVNDNKHHSYFMVWLQVTVTLLDGFNSSR